MVLYNPPKYRYALFEKWDQEAFKYIKETAKIKNYPQIPGDREDKNRFLTILIRTQKSLHDWRDLLVDILVQVKTSGVIDTKLLNKKYQPESVSKEVPPWVTYEDDKIVSEFIDALETRKIGFLGTDDEISEFVMRFILGQLGNDWESVIMMIWEMLGDENSIQVKDLNREMINFDYLRLFE